jgi:hypothetical protein
MEEPAAEEAAAAWRSRPRRAAVGGGMEEPVTPRHGGAQGGTGCRGGGSVEEPATPGYSWTGAIGRGGRVPTG